MGEHTLGNAGPGGDFTGERKELSRHGGSRVTDPVRCRLLRLIYSCLPSYKTYIQRGKSQRQAPRRARRALSCGDRAGDRGPCRPSPSPSSLAAKAVRRGAHTPALLLNNVELQFRLRISEVTVCLVCIKPKKQKHNQSGCEEKCGSRRDSFRVFGVTDASVWFQMEPRVRRWKQTSSYRCRSLSPLFANFFFFFKRKTTLFIVVYNVQMRSKECGENFVPFWTRCANQDLMLNEKAGPEWSSLSPGQFLIHYALSVLPINLIKVVACHILS